jgi:hypothetical protein
MSMMAPSERPRLLESRPERPSFPAKSRSPQEPTSHEPRAHEPTSPRARAEGREEAGHPTPSSHFFGLFLLLFSRVSACRSCGQRQGGVCSATDDDASKRTAEKLSKSNQPRPPTFGGPEKKKPSGLALRLIPPSSQSVPWATKLGEGTKAALCLSKSPDPATQTSSPGEGRCWWSRAVKFSKADKTHKAHCSSIESNNPFTTKGGFLEPTVV